MCGTFSRRIVSPFDLPPLSLLLTLSTQLSLLRKSRTRRRTVERVSPNRPSLFDNVEISARSTKRLSQSRNDSAPPPSTTSVFPREGRRTNGRSRISASVRSIVSLRSSASLPTRVAVPATDVERRRHSAPSPRSPTPTTPPSARLPIRNPPNRHSSNESRVFRGTPSFSPVPVAHSTLPSPNFRELTSSNYPIRSIRISSRKRATISTSRRCRSWVIIS